MPSYYYLAGPMRGHKLYNFNTFFAVAAVLRGQGHRIMSPAENDMANGFDPSRPLNESGNGLTLAQSFKWDFSTIAANECMGVILIPGWEKSKGVQAELVVAWNMGKPLYEYVPETGGLLPLKLEGYDVEWHRKRE